MHLRPISLPLLFVLLVPLLAACSSGQPQTLTPTSAPTTAAATSTAVTLSSPIPTAAPTSTTIAAQDTARPAGWDEATHGDSLSPSYAVVFPSDKVNQITISIAADSWEAMQANMTELLGEPGSGQGGGPGGQAQPEASAQTQATPEVGQLPQLPQGSAQAGQQPQGGPGGGDLLSENPMWVEATISFAGQTWEHVGIRYKG
ncbi:MAG: hypothetical protein HGA65_16565, partial [Oscillochloris sp.]|nr:hypothetical protein [Oscillochloris sp.]